MYRVILYFAASVPIPQSPRAGAKIERDEGATSCANHPRCGLEHLDPESFRHVFDHAYTIDGIHGRHGDGRVGQSHVVGQDRRVKLRIVQKPPFRPRSAIGDCPHGPTVIHGHHGSSASGDAKWEDRNAGADINHRAGSERLQAAHDPGIFHRSSRVQREEADISQRFGVKRPQDVREFGVDTQIFELVCWEVSRIYVGRLLHRCDSISSRVSGPGIVQSVRESRAGRARQSGPVVPAANLMRRAEPGPLRECPD